jgi:glycosyltransferase involved in cell wall biosynthesis
MQVAHRARRTWTRDVDRFITPSAFARNKLIEAGLPAARVSVRTNAVIAPTGVDLEVRSSDSGATGDRIARDGFLYVGRLAPNKGIATLLDAWRGRHDMPVLRIAGDGEMAADVRAAAASNPIIEYLGSLPHHEVVAAMRRSIALVVPSTWFEIQGLVILEAFSCATPVIASDIGAIPEAVREDRTGLLVPPGAAGVLAERVRWAAANVETMRSMGDGALAMFESDFSPERSLAQLVQVYETVRAERRTRRGAEPQLEPV